MRSPAEIRAGSWRPGLACLVMAVSTLSAGASPEPARIGPEAAPACPPDARLVPPAESIAAAAASAEPGDAFCLGRGVHRLQAVLPKAGQRFFGERGSVLSGARLVTDFVRRGDSWVIPDVKAATIERGICLGGGTLCRFPLGVFLDNTPLRRVGRMAELRAGAFFLDPARHEVLLADDPTGRTVEVSVENFAFTGRAPDVRIVGLTIEKYFSPPQDGALNALGSGWLIENSEFRLNGGAGVSISTDGVVRDCRIHSNGQLGATGEGHNLLFENNQVSNNNIYGFDPSWEAGGIKITETRNIVFRSNLVSGNAGPGLWCDEQCLDATYEGNLVEFNAGAGIFFELSIGAQIRDNRLNQNGQAKPSWYWGSDIQIAASENALIERNTITVRPGGTAIAFIDQNRHRSDGSYYRTQGNRALRNQIILRGEGKAGGVSDAEAGEANYGIIERGGNVFDENVYRVKPGIRPRFVWGRTETDFAGFRQRGQEPRGSVVTDRSID